MQVESLWVMMKFVDKYNIHIKFFQSKKHYFFIEALMRLRHKKPLNPYKGQTNNDKNEFNDDDFRQQGSPSKKTANGSTDQIYKYAKLLAKFIKTVNQDYNLHQMQPQTLPDPNPNPNPTELYLQAPDLNLINTSLKSQQIKYQKQVPKLQVKKEQKEEIREVKVAPKKKELGNPMSSGRQNKNRPQEPSIEPTKSSIMPKNLPEANNKIDKESKQIKNESFNQAPQSFASKPPPNPGFNMQAPRGNDGQAINMGLHGGLQNYMNMPGLFANQLLNMQSYPGLNQLQLGQLGQLGQIPIQYGSLDSVMQGYLQMGMNMPMMRFNMNNQMLAEQSFRPFQNLFSEQVKAYTQKNTQDGKKPKDFPFKRAAYHVGIAYKIYLDRLQKEGKNMQKYEEIDPTRHARRIKNSQTQSKSRDMQKKKK